MIQRPPRSQLPATLFPYTQLARSAALLLDDPTRCRKKLVAADRLLADDVTRRSRTRLQLRTLCRQLGHDPSLIDALRVPPLVLLQSGPDADRCANIVLPPLLLRLVKARDRKSTRLNSSH